jgi:hypothetical protein
VIFDASKRPTTAAATAARLIEPGEPLADHHRDRRERALVVSGAHHLLEVAERLLLQGFHDLVRLHHAEQVSLRVDDGKSDEAALLDQAGDLVARKRRRDGHDLAPHHRRDRIAGRCEKQLAHVQNPHELSIAIGDVEVVERVSRRPPQGGDRLADGEVDPDRGDARIHHPTRRIGWIVKQALDPLRLLGPEPRERRLAHRVLQVLRMAGLPAAVGEETRVSSGPAAWDGTRPPGEPFSTLCGAPGNA